MPAGGGKPIHALSNKRLDVGILPPALLSTTWLTPAERLAAYSAARLRFPDYQGSEGLILLPPSTPPTFTTLGLSTTRCNAN